MSLYVILNSQSESFHVVLFPTFIGVVYVEIHILWVLDKIKGVHHTH